MDTRKLAKYAVLDMRNGSLSIDNTPFGFFMADEPISVTLNTDGLQIINIPLIVENLEVIPAIEGDDEEFCDRCLAGTESPEHLTQTCGDSDL